MAYNGYRLKIGNVEFPLQYIAKGSFSVTEAKRVIETWTDANLIEHEITTGTPKATISFSIVAHDSDAHSTIVSFLRATDSISVNYYNDRTDAYRTVTCRLQDVTFSHLSAYGGKIQYAETPVTFIEN